MIDNWPEGRSAPFGVHASHNWVELGAIFRVIDDYNVKTFVELGTFAGGLSSFMLTRCQHVHNFFYMGVEKNPEVVDLSIRTEFERLSGATLQIRDVFEKDTQDLILNYLTVHPVRALVYCDNGDKPREVQTYMPLVPTGTLIMAHDWGTEIGERDLEHVENFHIHGSPWLYDTRLVLLEKIGG
jgi:hypothetical protein